VSDFTAGFQDAIAGMRFGVPRAWLSEGSGTDPEVLAAFEESLRVFRDLGAIIDDVDSKPFIDARRPQTMIIAAEAYAYHEDTIATRPQDFNSKVRNRIREGALISAADYIQAQRSRTGIRAAIAEIMKTHDAILSPTTAATAEKYDDFQTETRYSVPSFTNPANLTGLPALSIPCGFNSKGLPIGLQVQGRAFDEATVLRIGQAYESATGWHRRHPSL
jgi:aspartyl-tRNA(Asn)/glutamyl-tRNA(Gln) amidotransferase subunit A